MVYCRESVIDGLEQEKEQAIRIFVWGTTNDIINTTTAKAFSMKSIVLFYSKKKTFLNWEKIAGLIGRFLPLIKIRHKQNGTTEWIYGQCSFPYASGDGGTYKFVNTFEKLRRESVLPDLIERYGVDHVYFVEQSLLDRFAEDPSTRRYKACFTLVNLSDVAARP